MQKIAEKEMTLLDIVAVAGVVALWVLIYRDTYDMMEDHGIFVNAGGTTVLTALALFTVFVLGFSFEYIGWALELLGHFLKSVVLFVLEAFKKLGYIKLW